MKVQTIDYRSPEAPKLFLQSIRETGFAVLSHHPISLELIENTFQDWARFFASEEKHAYRFDPVKQAGYFPFGTEKAKDQNVYDLKEFFHYYPTRNTLPPQTEANTLNLYRSMSDLGAKLLGWIDDHTPTSVQKLFSVPLRKMIEGSQETLLRPIHYPPLQGTEEPGAIRAAAHEDINLITLLPAATAPGLQVRDLAGRWHDVSCDRGQIAINAGDMLQMASQGYYVSTTHRVINPVGSDSRAPRYSMPLFIHPESSVRLSEEHTARTYLEERLKQIGLLKK